MVLNQLIPFINTLLLREHWKNGGTKKRVVHGHPDFNTYFWLNEEWPWESVRKPFKNMSKNDFPGIGNLTAFLKRVIKQYFLLNNDDINRHVLTNISSNIVIENDQNTISDEQPSSQCHDYSPVSSAPDLNNSLEEEEEISRYFTSSIFDPITSA